MSGAEERLANDPTSELWGEHRSRYRFAERFITPGNCVVDIACGSGFGLEMLESAGAHVIGIDYDERPLHNVRQRIRRARLVRADGTRLALATDSVEAMVSFETLEHVHDARALVAELRRVLKRGGPLVLSTPNRDFRQTANPFHIREFTPDELCELMREFFTEVTLYGQRPSAAYRYVPFLMLGNDLDPAALAWKLMVRLPYAVKNALALKMTGRSFYPGEHDYCFDENKTRGAHALVAVAR